MAKGCCLLCKNFEPTAPADWSPRYQDDRYSYHSAANKIRETEKEQAGWCRLNPDAVEVWTNDWCASFDIVDYAVPSLSEFVWGTWKARQYEDAAKRSEELARQLKIARKISASRLQRLKKRESKR